MGVTTRLLVGWRVFVLVLKGRYCDALRVLLDWVTERDPVGAGSPERRGLRSLEIGGSERRWFPRR